MFLNVISCIGAVIDVFLHAMEYMFTWTLFIAYSHGRAHELRVLICFKYIGEVFDVFLRVI